MVLPLIDFNCQNLHKFIYKLSEHATPSSFQQSLTVHSSGLTPRNPTKSSSASWNKYNTRPSSKSLAPSGTHQKKLSSFSPTSHPSTPPSTSCTDPQHSASPDSRSPPRSPDDSPSHTSHKTFHSRKESSHLNTSPFPARKPNSLRAKTSPLYPEWSPLTVNTQNERNHSTPKMPCTHYAYLPSPLQADFTSIRKLARNRKEDHSSPNNEYGSTPNTDAKPWSSSPTDQKQIEQQAGPSRASMLARSYSNTTSLWQKGRETTMPR